MGISFYTFQALSYTIDVYRRELEAVHDPVRYFSFILFFPHLVAGPIVERGICLASSRCGERSIRRRARCASAGSLGYFIKVVIADNLAPVVSQAYDHVGSASGWQLLLRDGLLCHSDLLRFCRLYTHCDRHRQAPWHRPHAEFRLSVLLEEHSGILGTVAHLADNVVPRLRLPAARRQPRDTSPVDSERGTGLSGERVLAWSELDLSRLGPAPRAAVSGLFSRVARLAAPGIRDTRGGFDRSLSPIRASDRPDVFVDVRGLGVLPRGVDRGRAHHLEEDRSRRHDHFARVDVQARAVWMVLLLAIEWFQREYANPLHVEQLPRPLRWSVYYALAGTIFMFAPMNYTPFIYFQF